jgi:hypothetical protein
LATTPAQSGEVGTQLASRPSVKSFDCIALNAAFMPTVVRLTESRLKARLPDRIEEVSIDRRVETPPSIITTSTTSTTASTAPATGSDVTKSEGEHWKP